MLSLSLGRDGWVEAAAPAPRIECAFLRCAAFVAVQLVCWQYSKLHHWRRRSPPHLQRLSVKGKVAH